jgi:membrane-associated phospholipid phosphatase
VTNVVKLLVGRPRPNFAARCWPDGVRVGVPGVPVCSGEAHSVREGRKSFPSGHTSLATAGLAYLSFFLLATVRPRAAADGGAAWRTTAALSPLLLAMWVGLTRVRDYWHHWSDVATGAALGACIAYTVRSLAPCRCHAAVCAADLLPCVSSLPAQCLHKVAALRVLPVPTTSASPAASEPSSAGDEPEAAGEP